jgi:hypothetical protein
MGNEASVRNSTDADFYVMTFNDGDLESISMKKNLFGLFLLLSEICAQKFAELVDGI